MSRKAQRKYGPNGQYYRKRIKTPEGKYEDIYGKTLTELAEKVTVRQAELVAAANPPPAELYFYEYAAGWYARREPHMSENNKKMVRHQINKVICPVIGSKPIKEITSDDLAAVMATRGHLGRSSQQKTVLIIKQIFDAAMEAGVIDRSPARKLKAAGRPPEKKHALTEQQQADLINAVHGLSVEPCVMLGLYTGMRREEICALKWDSVELDGKAPHVIVRRACRWPDGNRPEISDVLKSDAAFRTIPIPPQLVQYLRQLKALQLEALQKRSKRCESAAPTLILDLCVYGDKTGQPVTSTIFRRRWEAIKYRSTASGRPLGASVRNHTYKITLDTYSTPHILRHTYITRLILGGMDLKRVQYLAGHSDPKVTLQIYTDLMGHAPEDLISDVNAIFAPAKKRGGVTP